jgi:hypothetical protein
MTEVDGSAPNGIVLSAAYGVALRAITGGLQAHEVDGLRVQAEELLPRDSALRTAIFTFATMYEADRRDPAALKAHGQDLNRVITWLTAPAAPDNLRRDIDG